MKIKIFIFSLFTICTLSEVHAQIDSNLTKEIDEFLFTEFPTNEPGSVVLISKSDSIIYRKSFGLANMEKNESIKTNMIFQIASMTKQFTSVAILQLVEQKKLSLQDTVQQYLNYFPSKKYPITIEHLLSQTSGIPEFFDIDENEYHLLTKEHSPEQLISYFKDEPLEFKPETRFRYSNSNYILLGAIIEKVSGIKYEEYLRKTIFKPLGMENSALWYQEHFLETLIPQGYMIKNDKYVPSIPMVGSINFSSGGIVSTVDDLFLWNRALKNRTILSEESTELLLTQKTLLSGEKTGYSFGFFTRELQGSPTIQHGGNLYGFTSSGLFLPNEDLFVCILSNTGFKRTEEIANYIASKVIGKPIKVSKKQDISFQKLNDYVGVYKLDSENSKVMKIIIVADRLVLMFPKQPGTEVDILPTKPDKFESKKVNAKLTFKRNENGDISGIIIKQGGKTNWDKIK